MLAFLDPDSVTLLSTKALTNKREKNLLEDLIMTELHIEEGVLHVGVNPLHHLLLLLHHVGQLTHTHKYKHQQRGKRFTAARKKIEKYGYQGKKKSD
jgi:hypothetical protein